MMGMVVSELVTNAERHAFGEGGGTIRVECRILEEVVECRISDDGVASKADVRPGTGLRIVEALSHALGAEFRFYLGGNGSMSTLSFPIAQQQCKEVTSHAS
jgi:two-component sensor histidine kinase